MARLIDITGKAISGEWGTDDLDGSGIPVLRTTNFTNTGEVSYANVVTRSITKKNISNKFLRKGDIIIEKSGGSDKQPVGRVIYFEGEENKYLFNNFTGLLRVVNSQKWHSKYVFYSLYAYYQKGGTRAFENKTTGLHNLKLENYLNAVEVRNLSLEIQVQRSFELDKLRKIITLRRTQLAKLDELVKCRFVELFGDIEVNPRRLPILPWNQVFHTTTGKLDANAMEQDGIYPFFTCAKESYRINSYAFDCEALLLAGNNAAGVYDVKHYKGKFNAYQRTYVLKLRNENWSYLLFKLQLENKLTYMQSQSKGTNTRYLTMGILNEINFIIPSVEEQQIFADFVHHIDKLRIVIRQSLDEAQKLFDSLMQEYFD